jgi:hypothetical protein
MNRISGVFLFGAAAFFSALGIAHAGSATGVEGLYYTGIDSSGGLLAGGSTDSHWSVSYASIGGTESTTYQGAAYVISTPAGGWVANTANAQWLTAPGNGGSDNLPGNGTLGANAASYVYTLAFNISGTGSGNVTNHVSISLTLAADDQAKIYVNPTLNADGSVNTSSVLSDTKTSAWSNTSATTLHNYNDGTSKNANFVIGTNYLVIQVDNTNSQTGYSPSNALNPSGLLVYQVGSIATIDNKPVVPEVGAWLPVLGALGLFCWRRFRTVKPQSVSA